MPEPPSLLAMNPRCTRDAWGLSMVYLVHGEICLPGDVIRMEAMCSRCIKLFFSHLLLLPAPKYARDFMHNAENPQFQKRSASGLNISSDTKMHLWSYCSNQFHLGS